MHNVPGTDRLSNKVINLMLVLATVATRTKVSKGGPKVAKMALPLVPLTVFHTLVVALEG
jgi:hypothetical protein